MHAAYVGELDAVKAILSKDGIQVNLTLCESSDCNDTHDFFVGTALENAIISRLPESISLLLKHPSIDIDQEFHGATALGVAINANYPEGIKLLVNAGAKLAKFSGQTLSIPSSS
jgi:ankyrin repeat protein